MTYLYVFEAGLVGLLAWQWFDNRFVGLNWFADEVERTVLPRWLRWSALGDPASWFHHAGITLLVAGFLGLASWLLADSFVGVLHGGGIMVGFYLVREGYGILQSARAGQPGVWWRGPPHYTGWLVDGLMDVLLPTAAVAGAWWLLL